MPTIQGMAEIGTFSASHLQAICNVLGDTNTGLTHRTIQMILRELHIPDVQASFSKRERLYEALRAKQEQDQCGNAVVGFIRCAMDPALYINSATDFTTRQKALNTALAFCGLRLEDDGTLHVHEVAGTLAEADMLADRLRIELERRNVHEDVLSFCRAELLQENYFHAVLEATTSVADKIRQRTGLTIDGADLVDRAFGLGRSGVPLLSFNTLQSQTELSEHKGLMHVMKGMFGAFRNVHAHAPKISWPISEQDALDLLTIASFLHRRIDRANSINANDSFVR